MAYKKQANSIVMAAVLFGTANVVNAAGFALIEQNASGMGNAFAGASAVAEDASTIYFNPAGMAYLPDSQLVVAAHAIRPSAEFSNNASRTISALGTPTAMRGSGGGDAGDLTFIPNIYFAKAISDTVHLGIGINAPFGLKTEYDNGWVGRYSALKSELKTININPAISYKASERFSVGAGLNLQRAEATLTNALDFGTICYGKVNPVTCSGVLNLTPQNADGGINIKGDDWGWGYNFGAIFQPSQASRIGVAYRSRVHHTLEGSATFSNVPAALAAFTPNGSVTAKLVLPDSLSASIAHQLNDQWELLADATWTHWATFKQLQVVRTSGTLLSNQPENWKNTMRYSIGASYRYNEKLKLRAGVAYDESPVLDDFRTPRIPDNDRTWLSLGASYKLSPSRSVDVGYTHLFVKEATLNQGAVGTSTGQLSGQYDSDVNILSAQYTHAF
ncbi:MAG: porin [Pseudomonadota bacterium]